MKNPKEEEDLSPQLHHSSPTDSFVSALPSFITSKLSSKEQQLCMWTGQSAWFAGIQWS
ncbi:hypothetical protein LINPERHAP1_LOCUS37297, partial [Linum perenne]